MMSRKDYETLADVFRGYLRDIADFPSDDTATDIGRVQAAIEISRAVASVLEQENPRFLRGRFMSACGMGDN